MKQQSAPKKRKLASKTAFYKNDKKTPLMTEDCLIRSSRYREKRDEFCFSLKKYRIRQSSVINGVFCRFHKMLFCSLVFVFWCRLLFHRQWFMTEDCLIRRVDYWVRQKRIPESQTLTPAPRKKKPTSTPWLPVEYPHFGDDVGVYIRGASAKSRKSTTKTNQQYHLEENRK